MRWPSWVHGGDTVVLVVLEVPVVVIQGDVLVRQVLTGREVLEVPLWSKFR